MTILLAMAACGSPESTTEQSAEPAEGHFLTEQQKALEKAKKMKEELEKAAARTQKIVDETIER
jgi:hypothetical protein